MITTGYQLANGKYYIVKKKNGSIKSIQQVMFGSGIYPAPIQKVKNNEIEKICLELSLSECLKK